MSEAEEFAFVRGQWFAYNEILGYLNTLETNLVDKKEIYKYVFELRPKKEDK